MKDIFSTSGTSALILPRFNASVNINPNLNKTPPQTSSTLLTRYPAPGLTAASADFHAMRKNRNNGNHPTTEGLRRKWSEDGGAAPGCGLGLKDPDLEAIGRRVRGNSLNSAEEEGTMKLKDIFVPRYLNSDSKVRMNLIKSTSDVKLLRSMAENDVDASVRKAAAERAEMLTMGQPHTA